MGFQTGARGYPQNMWPDLPELTLFKIIIILPNYVNICLNATKDIIYNSFAMYK